MLRLAAERERLTVIDDQVGAPTGADLLADMTAHALRAATSRPEVAGTYHAVAAGETTWHGYARFVIGFARAGRTADQGRRRCDRADRHERLSDAGRAAAQLAPRHDEAASRVRPLAAAWQDGVDRMLAEILI